MGLTLYLILQVATTAVAVAAACGVSRHRPHSRVGVVLRALDDRALVTGLTAGCGVVVLELVASVAVPVLAGSWWDGVGPTVTETAEASTVSTVVGVVLTVSALATPQMLMLALPGAFLRLSVLTSSVRVHGRRPVAGPVAAAAVCAAIGMPLAVAVGFGVATAAVGAHLRRSFTSASLAAGLREDAAMPAQWPGHEHDHGSTSAHWARLSEDGKCQVAAVAAAHLVCVMTVYVLVFVAGPLLGS